MRRLAPTRGTSLQLLPICVRRLKIYEMDATEHSLTSWDGTELFYRAWMRHPTPNRGLLLFHRGHEHSGRWRETVGALDLDDVAIFAWDARGHGRSGGERGAA